MDACLPACLPASPPARLPGCMHPCMHACMHACMLVRMYACTYICTYVDGRQSSQAGLQVGGQVCRRMHACMYKVCPHMHIGMSADICTVSVPRSPSNAMSLRLNRPFGDRIVLCVRECVCPGLMQETGQRLGGRETLSPQNPTPQTLNAKTPQTLKLDTPAVNPKP